MALAELLSQAERQRREAAEARDQASRDYQKKYWEGYPQAKVEHDALFAEFAQTKAAKEIMEVTGEFGVDGTPEDSTSDWQARVIHPELTLDGKEWIAHPRILLVKTSVPEGDPREVLVQYRKVDFRKNPNAKVILIKSNVPDINGEGTSTVDDYGDSLIVGKLFRAMTNPMRTAYAPIYQPARP